mgnify:CR=1 FL=1
MDDAAVRRRLLAERDELDAADGETAGMRAPVELDQQSVGRLSRMDAMQQKAMADAQARRRQMARTRIEAALRRLDDGSYGDCVMCGEEIAPKRLELDPAIPTCVACSR